MFWTMSGGFTRLVPPLKGRGRLGLIPLGLAFLTALFAVKWVHNLELASNQALEMQTSPPLYGLDIWLTPFVAFAKEDLCAAIISGILLVASLCYVDRRKQGSEQYRAGGTAVNRDYPNYLGRTGRSR